MFSNPMGPLFLEATPGAARYRSSAKVQWRAPTLPLLHTHPKKKKSIQMASRKNASPPNVSVGAGK